MTPPDSHESSQAAQHYITSRIGEFAKGRDLEMLFCVCGWDSGWVPNGEGRPAYVQHVTASR